MILSLVLATAVAFEVESCHANSAAKAVEARREEFNKAIKSSDLEGIENILAEDVILITGTWSDRFDGRQAQLSIWEDDFTQGDQRLVYVRTPSCVRSSTITEMATEYGSWLGESTSGDMASGSYTAKWRLIEGHWKLEAEIFMTEACAGSACPE